MLLYYITDRKQLSADTSQQCDLLLQQISAAARAGVDMIQIREKDLPARALESLAAQAVKVCRQANPACRVLMNSRIDIALASAADGVHLPRADISVPDARKAAGRRMLIGRSCHQLEDVLLAEVEGADFVVFGPIFQKNFSPQTADRLQNGQTENPNTAGIEDLKKICSQPSKRLTPMPVIALGGVTPENAAGCMRVGAAGVAGIRLFQQVDLQNPLAALTGLVARMRSQS